MSEDVNVFIGTPAGVLPLVDYLRQNADRIKALESDLAERKERVCETCADNDLGICHHLLRVNGCYVRCEYLGNFCGMWRARS